MKYTPDNITELLPHQVFVFGSNLSGIHGGGAARTAIKWGAEWGNPVGLQGQTYAIPTKSKGIARTLTIDEIRPFVDEFIQFAKDHPELEFLVTEIGCGLAGLTPEEVRPLFVNALPVENIALPKRFSVIRAWYFSTTERKLRHEDGRQIEVGVTHEVEGRPVLCEHGLHASVNILDALKYAPGPVLWEVELSGEIVEGDDKMAATHRTYLREIDCEEILREFARWCALQVIDLWDAPPVVREYLETGKEEPRDAAWDAAWAAWAAAWDAAWDAARAARAAAWDAAWDAAWAAARAAAWDAVWAAARDAARAAVWAAARDAAWDAAWAARDAAWDAAWDAARAAARDAQEKKLLELVNEKV